MDSDNYCCKSCNRDYEVSGEDLEFLRKISPVFNQNEYIFPASELCPRCRIQRILIYRNEFCYYSRKCDHCGKNIVSVHSEDKPYPVYCHKCWWSDDWNPLDFGQPYSSDRSFFEQFAELQSRVPQPAMMNDNGVASENCEYCQDFAFGRNCYLVTGSWEARDCLYSTNTNHVQDIIDCESVNLECELVFQSVYCDHIYGSTYLQNCSNCHNCHFGIDLKGCSDCLACYGLRQKKYHIFNKPFAADEYKEKFREFNLGSFSSSERLKIQFAEFIRDFPVKAVHQVNCENSRGNILINCKDFLGYDVINGEGCKYYYRGDSPRFSCDIYQSGNPQWCYQGVTPDNSYQTCFTTWCWKDKNVLYSDNCHSCENLIGSIALRRKNFCILNRQYSEDEYNDLGEQIAGDMQASGDWGSFFPAELSPFAYNESVAALRFPLEKEIVLERGLKWKEPDQKEYRPVTFEIPDHIKDVDQAILKEILSCKNCSKNYRIIPLELDLYSKLEVPIPRYCPDCRRAERLKKAGSMFLWKSSCSGCNREIETAYQPGGSRIILCEECYLKEIY